MAATATYQSDLVALLLERGACPWTRTRQGYIKYIIRSAYLAETIIVFNEHTHAIRCLLAVTNNKGSGIDKDSACIVMDYLGFHVRNPDEGMVFKNKDKNETSKWAEKLHAIWSGRCKEDPDGWAVAS